jgi:hypothetical protein
MVLQGYRRMGAISANQALLFHLSMLHRITHKRLHNHKYHHTDDIAHKVINFDLKILQDCKTVVHDEEIVDSDEDEMYANAFSLRSVVKTEVVHVPKELITHSKHEMLVTVMKSVQKCMSKEVVYGIKELVAGLRCEWLLLLDALVSSVASVSLLGGTEEIERLLYLVCDELWQSMQEGVDIKTFEVCLSLLFVS